MSQTALSVHGLAAILEDDRWIVEKRGTGCIIRPGEGPLVSWVHFAVPTLVILNTIRLKYNRLFSRLRSGSQATIEQIQIRDGDTLVADITENYSNPNYEIRNWVITPREQPAWNACVVSFSVKFGANFDSDAWIVFSSVAIEFV